MKLLFKGKARQCFKTLELLAQTHGKMTMREYFSLCVVNGGR